MFRLAVILVCVAALGLVAFLDREPLARALAGDVDAPALGAFALKAVLACLVALVLARMATGRMRPVTIALVFTAALAGWLASKPLERALRGGGGRRSPRPSGPPPRSRPSPRPCCPPCGCAKAGRRPWRPN
jgi:AcrR family transcriptional regulator